MAARKAAPKGGARVLAATVVLRHPEEGSIVTLVAGENLPEWAASEVGEHALVSAPADGVAEPSAGEAGQRRDNAADAAESDSDDN